MTASDHRGPSLLAVSDLHVSMGENCAVVDAIQPKHDDDWLLVAGDVAERAADVVGVLAQLAERFAQVVWTPGNHELWTVPSDPVTLRGKARYDHLVESCLSLGVLTPEDDFALWKGSGGPVVVAPLFLLYDYSFRPPLTHSVEESLACAYKAGVVCTDELMLHPDPYLSRQAWCAARVDYTEARLAALAPDARTVLVNHFPLIREPTDVLRYPEFAQWCGTTRTSDWHTRFRAVAAVYGHLHIPRSAVHDGVRFEEVSLGYPEEWGPRGTGYSPRQILPEPVR